ncbi:GMC oxidoreductase [Clavibacter michiganensis]|uniref:GMC oxidoreductase n=1 Tax=Clavibacter michiganensis TaxID=28447 RepID=UPI0026DCC2ED|nr:GMC oxidoreductase [Clavibacter michiganensis]MDO4027162.1 GMC oxidoreductase [Clavibacter michiganensis]MDO4135168.1 GMC oxidoreductase [Clavibacter michiganensis]
MQPTQAHRLISGQAREEALAPTGSPFDEIAGTFDYIIVGGGGTAAAFIDATIEQRPEVRVLVLEQGDSMIPTHAQNLGVSYQPLMASMGASPWASEGDLSLAPQVPHLGGRTLVWSGSCPQPTRDQLRSWPRDIVDDLDAHWHDARSWLGVRPAVDTGPEYAALHAAIRRASARATVRQRTLVTPACDKDLDAPLAYLPHVGGGGQKFAAIVPLVRAAAVHNGVQIVTGCMVHSLSVANGEAVAIRTNHGNVDVRGSRVILAAGSAEATSIVLRSRPELSAPLAGARLSASAASFSTCRIPRSAFRGLSHDRAELAALYINGTAGPRDFHLHLTAAATSTPARDLQRVFHLLPDMFGDGTPERMCDPEHVVLLVHGLCQIGQNESGQDMNRIWIDTRRRTISSIQLDDFDRHVWDQMDEAIDAVVSSVAGGGQVEYWNALEDQWQRHPPSRRMPTAFHETGTLCMGTDAASSVTDTWGQVRGATNLFILGGATFPFHGSWNPFLTMVALARRLARELERRGHHGRNEEQQ